MSLKLWRVVGSRHGRAYWVEDAGGSEYIIHGDTPGQHPPLRRKGKNPRSTIEYLTGKDARLRRASLAPGAYHPRIWRPHCWPRAPEHYEHEWSSAVRGARNLFVGLHEVFRHVEPTQANWKTFGHEIRQLLVLACTEVEAQCKGILRANGYKKGGNWTMHDYFMLAKPMRLSEWKVRLFRYPGLAWMKPFRSWSGSAYRGLTWYGAYNKVKHDRETEFRHATLGHMIEAMGAVYMLVVAQFGQFGYSGFNFRELDDFAVRWPPFGLDQHYVPPHVQATAKWHPCPYFQ